MPEFEQLFLIGVMLALVVALVSTAINPAALFGAAITICYLFGLVELDILLANFTNLSLVTLLLLLMASLAIEQTRLIGWLSGQITTSSLSLAVVRLGISTAVLSSFSSNTAVVAALIKAVKENPTHAPSKLLLPLSYASILGGTLTLIGTSTNLVVNGFVQDAGLQPLGFFDFSLVGLAVLTAGLITIVIFSRYLPDNRTQSESSAPFHLEAIVSESSSLIGKTVEQDGLRRLNSLFLAEIIRDGKAIVPVSPHETILENDTLLFVGDINSAHALAQFKGLQLINPKHNLDETNELLEVVVSHSGEIAGKTLKQVNFREKFDAAVVAIRRGHTRLKGGLGTIKLQPGDSMILAPGEHFEEKQLSREFVYVSGLTLTNPLGLKTSIAVIGSFMLALLLSMMQIVPLEKGLLILVTGYVLTGVISARQIWRRFPIELFIIIGAAFGLAKLMVSTGVSPMVSELLSGYIDGWTVLGAFIAIYLITLIFTELITNTAAAALVFPIAYALAISLNVNPMPFIMAVVFGASASFISPYGYQTNLMVYSAGDYEMRDYLKLGIPTSIAYSVTALLMIPVVFPF
jgi:di/tricarboxylate transporter